MLRVKNTRTGKTAEFAAKLLELLQSIETRMAANAGREENHSHGGRAPVAAEGTARKIARWPDADVLVVTPGGPSGGR